MLKQLQALKFCVKTQNFATKLLKATTKSIQLHVNNIWWPRTATQNFTVFYKTRFEIKEKINQKWKYIETRLQNKRKRTIESKVK